jgi:ubiquinone/menaquinone biosynthesis C-methylase UbiE
MEKIYNPDINAKIQYLENAKKHTQSISEHSYKLLSVAKGQTILEFGCGSGYDVFEMAKLVGDSGKVYGVDIDLDTVEYVKSVSTYPNVFVEQNIAQKLPYQNDFFDIIRLERVLQHVENADATVADLVRTLKKNGQLGVIETDWASLNFFSQHKDIERKITNFITEKAAANGLISRRIADIFVKEGLQQVRQEPYSLSIANYEQANDFIKLEDIIKKGYETDYLTAKDVELWNAEVQHRKEKGLFIMQTNFLIITGIK